MIKSSSNTRKLDRRVSKNSLLTSLCVLYNQFVVKGEVSKSTGNVPDQVVMHSAVAIVSIYQLCVENLVFGVGSKVHEGLILCLDVDLLGTVTVMVVGQLAVVSLLLDNVWSLKEILVHEFYS